MNQRPPTGRIGRRRLLQGSAVALGGGGVGWAGSAAARAAENGTASTADADTIRISPTLGAQTVAAHGPHQAGITTTPQAHVSLVGLDLRDVRDAAGLRRLLRVWGDDIVRLTRGEPALADTEPELAQIPARLTVTIGLGPRAVRRAVREGAALGFEELPSFATDDLREEWGQTDLAVQICAEDPMTVAHARRVLTKNSRAYADVTWVQHGFRRAAGSEADGATMRNLMGQVDGTVNLAEADPTFAGLVWTPGVGNSHLANGTFLVVRRIETHLDTWDEVGRQGRELAVGRRLDNGAPLTGSREFDEPDFEATDASGLPVIDPASHIRRARSEDPRERFLRRSYNYSMPRPDGTEESGLIFICFAADVGRQFVPIQRRLAEQDRLNEWVTTIGSAVYYVLPGAPEGDFVGQGLI